MEEVNTAAASEEPSFVTYMLSEDYCDCFFVVGNEELGKPERIGVVIKNLLSQSVVLRSEMMASNIKNKKDVYVTDTYPDTFKNLLRFVYGYDITRSLSFDETDNLLYLAEKYQVMRLKSRLSSRLIALLNPENICHLLNNPACFRDLELDAAIRKILQHETDKVLASPPFLDLTSDALVKVFEQGTMNVDEIEVWRAAVRWAKHRANSDDAKTLRRVLEKPAKQIRLSTIDTDTFCKEVVTTGVLTNEEVVMVCMAKGKGAKQEDLVNFSNDIEQRKESLLPELEIQFNNSETLYCHYSILMMRSGQYPIELLPLTLKPAISNSKSYYFKGIITIYQRDRKFDSPINLKVCQEVQEGEDLSVPLAIEGKNIVLSPNMSYQLVFFFQDRVTMYRDKKNTAYINDHLTLWTWAFNDYYRVPCKSLPYRPLL